MVKKRVTTTNPAPIGDILFPFLEKIGGCRERSRIASLWSAWDTVVGDELGECVEEIEEKDRTLIIRVADAMLMQEISFRKEEIREKVNSFLGSPYFESVRLTL